MSPQSFTTKLLSISLLATSVGGTLALFSSVPLVAQVTNQSVKAALQQFSPDTDRKTPRWNAGNRTVAELPPRRNDRPALRINLPR